MRGHPHSAAAPPPPEGEIGMTRLNDEEGKLGRQTWLVTRGPRDQATTAELWSLVWQQECRLIVMLTRTFECIKVMCVQYWPNATGVTERYGDVHVTLIKEEVYAHYKVSYSNIRNERKTFIKIENKKYLSNCRNYTV